MKEETKPQGLMKPRDDFFGAAGFMENLREVFVGESAQSPAKNVIPKRTANYATEDDTEEIAGVFEVTQAQGHCC